MNLILVADDIIKLFDELKLQHSIWLQIWSLSNVKRDVLFIIQDEIQDELIR